MHLAINLAHQWLSLQCNTPRLKIIYIIDSRSVSLSIKHASLLEYHEKSYNVFYQERKTAVVRLIVFSLAYNATPPGLKLFTLLTPILFLLVYNMLAY